MKFMWGLLGLIASVGLLEFTGDLATWIVQRAGAYSRYSSITAGNCVL